MFDDLDDDDVTDLLPDSESERKEKRLPHEKDQSGRRMTVSEVRKIKKQMSFLDHLLLWFFKDMKFECDYVMRFLEW